MTDKIKIAVVDDHEFFRKGVILTLSQFRYATVVFEASSGEDFLSKLLETPVHIVLMDIKMPGINGIEATRQALKINPSLKIIALTMFGDEEYLESMIEAGAQGFILKNIDKEGLDRALQVVAQDNQYFSEELLTYMTRKYLNKKEENNAPKLTKREVEVLQFIAEGLSNKEIAGKINVSVRTVTNHRANINCKVGTKNTAGLLAYAIKNKLVKL